MRESRRLSTNVSNGNIAEKHKNFLTLAGPHPLPSAPIGASSASMNAYVGYGSLPTTNYILLYTVHCLREGADAERGFNVCEMHGELVDAVDCRKLKLTPFRRPINIIIAL